jgi:hypothetical protein
MANFLEGEVNKQIKIQKNGQVKYAQSGRREGEDKSELERMLEEGWVQTSSYEEGKDMAFAYADFLPEDVVAIYAENWAKSGDNTIALSATRKSKEWEKEFGFLKRKDGSLVMDEVSAISTKASYKESLSEVGVTNFEDFESYFNDMIGGGEAEDPVSAREFQDRIDIVYAGVKDKIPEVEQLFRQRYGLDVDSGSIFAALVNPTIEDKLLAGDISTLNLQAQAKAKGFSSTFNRFEQLRKLGMTEEQAKSLYGGASSAISSAKAVGRDLDISTLEGSVTGDMTASQRLERIQGNIASQMGYTLGAAKKDGKVTGLSTR